MVVLRFKCLDYVTDSKYFDVVTVMRFYCGFRILRQLYSEWRHALRSEWPFIIIIIIQNDTGQDSRQGSRTRVSGNDVW